jgi:hypothetical protein
MHGTPPLVDRFNIRFTRTHYIIIKFSVDRNIHESTKMHGLNITCWR